MFILFDYEYFDKFAAVFVVSAGSNGFSLYVL